MSKIQTYTFTTIDGTEKTLNFQLLEAKQGLDVFLQLSPIFAGFFTGKSISEIFDEIRKTCDIFQLMKTLLTGATIDRGDGVDFPLDPNTYFAGNYGEMCDILVHVIKANFGTFMEAGLVKSQSKIAQSI